MKSYEQPAFEVENSQNLTPEVDHSFEEQEQAERLVEGAILRGHKINEGKYGIIYEIDFADLADEAKRDFFPEGTNAENMVGKILKIYQPVVGKAEADSQKKAYLVNGQNQDPQAAKIPKLISYQDFAIKSDELKSMLKANGLEASDRVCIILMDFIKGEDFGTYLYKRILESGIQSGDDLKMEDLQRMAFPALERLVIDQLAFKIATPSQKVEGLEPLINANNTKKLVQFATHHNIVLDKKIFDKIRLTLNKIHAGGLYHCDLHERNIMLELNDAGEILDVYLIDFGKSKDSEDEDSLNDSKFLKNYQSLSLSQQEKSANRFNDLSRTLEGFKKNSLGRPDLKQEWGSYKKILSEPLQANNFDSAYESFINILAFLGNNEEKAAALLTDLHQKYPAAVVQLVEIVIKNTKQRPQFWLDFRAFLTKDGR